MGQDKYNDGRGYKDNRLLIVNFKCFEIWRDKTTVLQHYGTESINFD